MSFDYKIIINRNEVDQEQEYLNTPMTFSVSKRFSVEDSSTNANELFFSRNLSIDGGSTILSTIYDMIDNEPSAKISLYVRIHGDNNYSEVLKSTPIKYVELRQSINGLTEGSSTNICEELRFNFKSVE